MEKRVLLTIAMCVGIIAAWTLIQRRFFAEAPPPVTAAAPAAPAAPPQPGGATPPATSGAPAAPTAGRPPEQRATIQHDGLYRAVFSSWGAAPVEFTLLNPQYKVNLDGNAVPINLVHPGQTPYTVHFSATGADAERSDFGLDPTAAWTMVRQSDEELVYAVDVGAVHLEKRWQLPREGYRLALTVTVENKGDKPVSEHLITTVTGFQDPNVKGGGFLSFGKRVNLARGECELNGKAKRLHLEEGVQKPFTEAGDVRWIGVAEQFFMEALAFGPEEGGQGRLCSIFAEPGGTITTRAVFGSRTIAPGAKAEYPMAPFLGPMLLSQLDAVTVGGVDPKLGDAVDYTIEFVARPMFWVLRQIQRVTINWGLAIIVITLLLKLVMFYPTQKSMQSARAMAKLKPEIDKLKAKHGDDKQAFNQAQMQLYKEKGVNPLGGCLPMLLQMPIYIAFYSMLGNAVELYRASFVGPINDMTAPYWPLAVATGAIMFVQQKISPTSPDSQQQKMMMYLMPVMFMTFTLMLPSGLTLYIFVNTLLGMAQQWWINSRDPRPAVPPHAKGAKPARVKA